MSLQIGLRILSRAARQPEPWDGQAVMEDVGQAEGRRGAALGSDSTLTPCQVVVKADEWEIVLRPAIKFIGSKGLERRPTLQFEEQF